MTPETPKTRMIRVPARELRIHPTAQRDGMNHTRLRGIIALLDLDAIGALHAVAYRPGEDGQPILEIVDGQHRWRALEALDLLDWEVEVMVHDDIRDDAAASALFLKLNTVAQVDSFSRFRNAVQSGDPDAVAVMQIVRGLGYQVSRNGGGLVIRAPNSLLRIVARPGGVMTLRHTIEVLTEAFGRTAEAVEGKLIEGTASFLHGNNGQVDRASLVKRLARFPGGASGIIGMAKTRTSGRDVSLPASISEVIADTYNKGRRTHRVRGAER